MWRLMNIVTELKKNELYDQLRRKYREYYPDADKSQLVKKFNSLRTNFIMLKAQVSIEN